MKNLKQLLLLLVLMSMSGTKALAYDFSAENDDGVTIFYNILSNSYDDWRVEVTDVDVCYSGNLVLPSTVTYYGTQYNVAKINGNAFSNNSYYLTSIVIPSSVTDIDGYTFSSCDNLASIIVSENNPVYDSRDNCIAVIRKESNFLVCGCKNTTIPNSVVGIGDAAFYNCSGLTSIEIPNSVVYIANQAFQSSGLTSITIPSSVTKMEYDSFRGCSHLESITVDSNNPKYDSRDNCNAIIETDNNNLVEGCKNTVIPSTVISIGNEAFCYCYSLTSIEIPNSVKSIGNNAFYGCNKLASIEIPNSVTSIGYEAFDGTSWYNNKPNGLVYAGKVAYKYKGTMPSGTNIVLEEGTVGVASYAFSNCTGLTEIEIPNSVTNIGRYAFRFCTGLTEIEIPNSITNIGYGAFSGCNSIKTLTIGTANVEDWFRENYALTTVTLSEGVKTIVGGAFYGCSNLSTVTIPSSVTTIGNSAFYGTPWYNNKPDGLVYAGKVAYKYKGTMPAGTNLVLEDGTTGISGYAFDGCTGLASIEIPNSMNNIGEGAFQGCSNLYSITIPNSVKSIGTNAFSGCTNITKLSIGIATIGTWFQENTKLSSVTMTDGVTSIGNNAFKNCMNLESVSIPSSVTSIGNSAFLNCRGLTSITIPSNVTTIGSSAFSGCNGIYIVSLRPTTPPSVSGGAFSVGWKIIVPTSSLTAYKNAEEWATWKNYIFSEEDAIKDINVTAQNNRSSVHSVIGEDNLENVVSLKLSGTINGYDVMILRDKMPNLNIIDLTNANIVASNYEYYTGCTQTYNNVLPAYMFYNQTKLKVVKLPQTITRVDKYAFAGSSIQTVIIPNECKYIDNYAFSQCSKLNSVDFTNSSIRTIGDYAFATCNNLSKLDLSNSSIQSIGSYAFTQTYYESPQLSSVDLSNSAIQSIGQGAFSGCSLLTSINLTGCSKLTTIGSNTFNRTRMSSVQIPQSVQTIGEAFSNCPLRDVYVQTIIPRTITSNTFSNAANATLHVPSLSYYNYYWATGWSQFKKIVEDTNPDYFYVDDDLTVEDGRATDDPVDADIVGTSGIVVEDDEQTFDEVNVADGGSLIPGANTTVNILNLNITVTANKWQFISFPYRVKLSDVVAPGFYVFRRYDGAQRASTGGTGWASLAQETEYLEPGVGYIFQSSQSGTLGIRTENPDLSWGTGKTNPLSVYTTDNIQHASWNYVGNPLLCYYDIDDLHTTAPLTFWNGSSYVARRPGDDNYQMKPFEAFFLQKPNDVEALVYEKSGRMTYKQAQEHHNNKNNNARAAERSERFLINLSLTQGQWEDEARVVYNNKKTTAYEPDCDAAKFMSIDVNMPQLYSLQGSDRFAINERPAGEVQLGFTAAKAGELTISAGRMDIGVLLRDNLTGTTHDLSQGGYTFTTEAGTYEERFTLLLNSEATDISDAARLNDNGEMINDKLYDLQGRRTTNAAQKGVRIVRKNHETRKVVR